VQRRRGNHPTTKPKHVQKGQSKEAKSTGIIKRLKYPLIVIWFLVFALFVLYVGRGYVLKTIQSEETKASQMPKVQKAEKPQKRTDKLRKLMNKHDKSISDILTKANKLLEQEKLDESLREFTFLSSKYPQSPLAKYNKAQALDKKAHKMRSNELLLEAASTFHEAADMVDCPPELIKLALKKHADILVFLGRYKGAIRALERLALLFPSDHELHRNIGVNYLMAGRTKEALGPFQKVFELNPTDGHAKSHVGFILKALNKLEESIKYFDEGIHSGHPGADDAKFFYHLGDAYHRIGKPDKAHQVYEEGARKGLFLSAWQRSLYNADTPLKAQAWWTHKETNFGKHLATLEKNWKIIRDEAVSLLDARGQGGFQAEAEKLQDTGDWKQLTLYQQGRRDAAGCKRAPKTCGIISEMSDATGCSRGQIKFSVMYPGTHVWPHTGPTNCRLRAHLGLVIPKNVSIKAGDELRTWQEGKVLVFDDSFEHEVWHNGTSLRLIFIIDFWHPDLTPAQKRSLSPI